MSNVVYVMDPAHGERIFQILYHGSRPPGVRYPICACGAVANLEYGYAEAVGWQLLPHAKCPGCRTNEPYTGPARERYLLLVEKLLEQKGNNILATTRDEP